ncbi:MAG: hypothetical protein H6834_06810 [Planctomycetes bacterium]|nr:hypothetical protein [Planctomycetota bacterium]
MLLTTAGVWFWPDPDLAWLPLAAGLTFTWVWCLGGVARSRAAAESVRIHVSSTISARATCRIVLRGADDTSRPIWAYLPRGKGVDAVRLDPRGHEWEPELPDFPVGCHRGRLATIGIGARWSPVTMGRAVRGELMVVPTTRDLPFRDAPRAPQSVAILGYEPLEWSRLRSATRTTAWNLWMAASRLGLQPGGPSGRSRGGGPSELRRLWFDASRDADGLIVELERAIGAGADEIWIVGSVVGGGRWNWIGALPARVPSIRFRWIGLAEQEGSVREFGEAAAWASVREAEGRSLEWLARMGYRVARVPVVDATRPAHRAAQARMEPEVDGAAQDGAALSAG